MRVNAFVTVFLVMLLSGAPGASQGPRFQATVVDAFGTAQKQSGDPKAPWQNVSVGELLPPQTMVKTGENSAVLITMPGAHVMRIGSQTTIQLRELGRNKSFSFEVLSGKIWSAVRAVNKPTKYEVETPSAVAGVEGTLFAVIHDQASAETVVSTHQGTVNLQQGGRNVKVTQGLTANVKRGQKEALAAHPTPPNLQSMWQMIRKEGWASHAGPGAPSVRLNRDDEEHINDAAAPHPQEKKKVPAKKAPHKRK